MVKQILILAVIILSACGENQKPNTITEKSAEENVTTTKQAKVENALAFINGYVENANKLKQAVDAMDWVNANTLVTIGFKTEFKKIIDDALKQDPELGLDADPIFDAQDSPDKGFELDTFDEKTNYITLKGKDWPEFKLTLKMLEQNGNWLVDGCGIINIPANKRAKQ